MIFMCISKSPVYFSPLFIADRNMNSYLALFLLFAIYTFANSQFQTRCYETPALWHGHFREIDYDTGFVRFAQMDYDAANKRIHVIELEKNLTRRLIVEQWVDYVERIVYIRTITPDETCSRHGISDDSNWRPFGVPVDSKFVGREWLGAERVGLGLEVDEFYEERDGGLYHAFFVPVLGENEQMCVPIAESYVRTLGPFSDLRNVHYEFFNITTTVSRDAFVHCEP